MDFERILGVPSFIVVLTPSCCVRTVTGVTDESHGRFLKTNRKPPYSTGSNRSTYQKASRKVSWGLPYVTSLTILTVNTTRLWRKLIRYLMIMFIIITPGFFWTSIDLHIFTFLFFILFLGYSSSAKPSRKRCQNWIQSGCPLSTDMLIHLCGISPSRQQAMRGTFFPCMHVGTYLNSKGPRNKVTKFKAQFLWIFHLS